MTGQPDNDNIVQFLSENHSVNVYIESGNIAPLISKVAQEFNLDYIDAKNKTIEALIVLRIN
jgi:hypothetical protein